MHATVRTEGLNVHAIPAGKIINALKKGDRVRITGNPTGTATVTWWPIEGIGLQAYGWVDGRFLEFEHENVVPLPPPAASSPRPAPQLPPDVPNIPVMDDIEPSAWMAIGIAMVSGLALIVILFSIAWLAF
jgi:hypothetical protein